MTSRRAAPSLALSTALFLSACGSRSALSTYDAIGDGGSGGGSTTATTGSTSSTSLTTSPNPECDGLLVQANWVIGAPPEWKAEDRPQLALFPGTNDALIAARWTDSSASWVWAGTLPNAWTTWPPEVPPETPHLPPGILVDVADDFAVGPGPEGPTFLYQPPMTNPMFATVEGGILTPTPALSIQAGEPLFAAGVSGRALGANRLSFEPFYELSIGSAQPGNLPQSESPLLCTTTPTLADAVPSGSGFLAAIAEVDPIENDCIPGSQKAAALRVQVRRYESPPGPGSFIEMTVGDGVSNTEPIARLAITPTSFGAWVVYQTDGSTSEQMPPIGAFKVDPTGHMDEVGGVYPVSPDGITWPSFAAATMVGDRLAVAHVDNLDPTAPQIVIEVYNTDGSLLTATAIETYDAWLGGRIEMLASPDGRSLLVAWEITQDHPRIALTRVDCLIAL